MTGAVRVTRDRGVGWLTFHRPEARNALTMKMRLEAMDLIARLEADDRISVIGVTGAGSHFCGGGDIDSMPELLNAWQGRARTTTAQDLALSLYQADKPTVAVAQGAVVGLGVSVFAACDIRLASPTARFQAGFPGLGLVPDGGLLYLLPRLIGWGRARQWMLLNAPVSGDAAHDWGLVSMLAEPEDLDATAATVVEQFRRLSPQATALAKAGLRVAADAPLASLLEFERTAQGLLIDSAESRTRVNSFLSPGGTADSLPRQA